MKRLHAAGRREIYTGDGSAWEVSVLDGTGRLVRVIRRADVDRHLSAADIERFEAALPANARTDAQRTWLRSVFADWTHPERPRVRQDPV
ncbi:MAG: hypothetical protein DIU52_014510 [bacterium]|nr:MAG: hypothetical protein DIU52_05765 [bacterium]